MFLPTQCFTHFFSLTISRIQHGKKKTTKTKTKQKSKRQIRQKCPNKPKWNEKYTILPWNSFCVGQITLGTRPALKSASYTHWQSKERNDFSLCQWLGWKPILNSPSQSGFHLYSSCTWQDRGPRGASLAWCAIWRPSGAWLPSHELHRHLPVYRTQHTGGSEGSNPCWTSVACEAVILIACLLWCFCPSRWSNRPVALPSWPCSPHSSA